MAFSKEIKEAILVKAARHCSICRKFVGLKVEIHHIIPLEKGGKDSVENAIALCFDCHCDAGHYNPKHPKGTKYSPTELKRHKKTWEKFVQKNSISMAAYPPLITHLTAH
jgi:5-methylcytosine-specific restriction endonuclease McrA